MTVDERVDALFEQLCGTPPEQYPDLIRETIRLAVNDAVRDAYLDCEQIANSSWIGGDAGDVIGERLKEKCG